MFILKYGKTDHTVVADREVGLLVYGFDRFVSYAYAGGLDLEILN